MFSESLFYGLGFTKMVKNAVMIDALELSDLLGITHREANRVIRTVNQEMERKGFLVIKSRPQRAPRVEVLKRLGIGEQV